MIDTCILGWPRTRATGGDSVDFCLILASFVGTFGLSPMSQVMSTLLQRVSSDSEHFAEIIKQYTARQHVLICIVTLSIFSNGGQL